MFGTAVRAWPSPVLWPGGHVQDAVLARDRSARPFPGRRLATAQASGAVTWSMGYDVHITRHAPWWADETEQITTQEWAAVVAADSDLEMVQVAGVSPRGQDAVLEYRHAWLAQMVTYPERDTRGAWLDWRDGRIVVTHPDELLLEKMREIAGVLGARVQGDDCEYYDE